MIYVYVFLSKTVSKVSFEKMVGLNLVFVLNFYLFNSITKYFTIHAAKMFERLAAVFTSYFL